MGLIADYIDAFSDTEIPNHFSRWSLLGVISALHSSSVWFTFCGKHLKPNIYIMLMGSSGSRKSSAIAFAEELIRNTGYEKIAATKTSKEKFLLDLAGVREGLDGDSFCLEEDNDTHETAIFADEANDFFGISNIEFLSALGSMWDRTYYDFKTKSNGDIHIKNPAITILSGNTATNFTRAFPPDIIGQGFFSRLLLIYANGLQKREAFPEINKGRLDEFVETLQKNKIHLQGEMKFSAEGKQAMQLIYEQDHCIGHDPRFESYMTRRHTHLIKLCMCVSLSKAEMEMSLSSVVEANTYLTFAESLMPKALGEYGRSRNAAVAHAVHGFIEARFQRDRSITTISDIMQAMSQEFDNRAQLLDIIRGLVDAKKINGHGAGFTPAESKEDLDPWKRLFVSKDFLTRQELEIA